LCHHLNLWTLCLTFWFFLKKMILLAFEKTLNL
jgi:hypothetical protein